MINQLQDNYNMISNVSNQSKWEVFIYSKIDMSTITKNNLECSFYCLHMDMNCSIFVYQNGHCYIGDTILTDGNVTENDIDITTLYLTDSALSSLIPSLFATYCCVTSEQGYLLMSE